MEQALARNSVPAETAYRLAWTALCAGACGALGVLAASGMSIDPATLLPFAMMLSLLFAAHFIYRHHRPSEALSLITGALALMIGCALFAGIIANAGLRLRYPLIDADLARADLTLGIDTPAVVLAFAARPWLGAMMGLAYSSIFPLALVTAIGLGTKRRVDRAWEFAWAFGGGIVIAATVSVFAPALGNIAHSGLGRLAGAQLPEGAGVYHLGAVSAYRGGSNLLLDMRKLEGVVTFPSFHMIMAMAVAHALRGTRLAWAVYGWCVLVAVSTIPVGGHYVIDLIGGAALWAACILLARRLAGEAPAARSGAVLATWAAWPSFRTRRTG
jgi:membrane-associated phospholipid phosphatase